MNEHSALLIKDSMRHFSCFFPLCNSAEEHIMGGFSALFGPEFHSVHLLVRLRLPFRATWNPQVCSSADLQKTT